MNLEIQDKVSSGLARDLFETTALVTITSFLTEKLQKETKLKQDEINRRLEELPTFNISLLLTDNSEIHQLNKKHLDIDAPTDVLSFPQFEDEQLARMDYGDGFIGDIAISLPYVIEEAKDNGEPDERDIIFVFIHGVLHLMGLDHQTESEEEFMMNTQEIILDTLIENDVVS